LWQPKADLPYNYYPIFINTSEVFVKTHYTKLISQGQRVGGASGWFRALLVRILNALQLAKAKAKTQKGNNEKRVI